MISLLRRKLLFPQRFLSYLSVNKNDFQPVIGLEVHVQLATRTKLFSRAPVIDDSPPNSQVCNFDMAEPGTLPRLNKAAVMHALRMALLLNCEIPSSCRFDRKHYFYADMPAGYQITQSSQPVAKRGQFGFYVYSENVASYWKEVDIIQLQLEQDSGKTIHMGNKSLIDLNRAGIPLVEVVTAPSFSTALEALCFVQQLRLILIHYGMCSGDLHKGHMRIDANVSLSKNDDPGIRTEIKNMNSFRHLHLAINYEINRQYTILSSGGNVINETRACDQQGRTVSMRDKEEETDYRFLPEPNLPTLNIRPEWIEDCRQSLVKARPTYQSFIGQGFDPRVAIYYAEDPLLCHFVSNCLPYFDKVSIEMFNSWFRELKMIMQRSKNVFPPQSECFAQNFMSVVSLYENDEITKLRVLEIIRQYLGEVEKRQPKEIIDSQNLWRIKDTALIDSIGREVFQKNEKIVIKAKTKSLKAITKLRSAIVAASDKRIDVEDAEACVIRLLRL